MTEELAPYTTGAPRLTEADIGAAIQSAHYFTAQEGADGAVSHGAPQVEALRLLTFCVLVLKNGFTVTGESACVSAANFDAGIGRNLAYAKARDKVWQLEGYLLKQRLHEGRANEEGY